MSRSYIKMECLAEKVFRRNATGETNREIGEYFALSKEQVKQLAAQQSRKQRLVENGYVPQPKGRPRKDAYVFKWPNGTPFHPDYVSKHFALVLRRNNLPHIRFHELRHSCASLLLNSGFTLKDVQE